MKKQNVKFYLAGAVSLITFLVYLYTLRNGFVEWDDRQYVFENLRIRSFDLTFLRWAFFDFHMANWHPLTWISHALDYALWGLNPLGHHLTSLILHAVNTFIVVLLVVRLLEAASLLNSPHPPLSLRGGADLLMRSAEAEGGGVIPPGAGDSRFTLIAAATTGLLFGIHPLHVESVAWVAERKDLLCALFYLLSIMAYTGYVGRGGSLWPPKEGQPRGVAPTRTYILSLGFFTLALLSKPMAVSLPVVLLILDWYPLKRIQSMKSFWSGLFEKLPFLALSLVSSVLTILAQKAGGAMAMTEFVPLSTRLLVAAQSLISYLWKILLPVNLSPYYPYPKEVSLLSWQYLSAIVLALGITAACVVIAKKQKVWLSAWSYYVMTLIPVIGIVQVGGQATADRYMYLPCLGPFLVIGLAAARVFEKMQTPGRRWRSAKFLGIAAAILVLLSLAYFTLEQIAIWRDSLTLWNYVIEKEPETVPLAYNNRGLVFSGAGRFERAIADFNKAVSLNPADYEGYNNRALAFSQMGRLDEAIADFDKAIALNQRFYQAYNNKGKLYGQAGLFDKAIEQFSKAIDINPDSSLAYGNRGLAYSLIGEYDKALQDLNKAVESDEHNAEAYGARGNLYLRAGDRARAVSDFQRACDLGDEKGCDVLQLYLK